MEEFLFTAKNKCKNSINYAHFYTTLCCYNNKYNKHEKKTMPFEFNYTLLHFYYICKFLFAQ